MTMPRIPVSHPWITTLADDGPADWGAVEVAARFDGPDGETGPTAWPSGMATAPGA
jgi:hypothetical protein